MERRQRAFTKDDTIFKQLFGVKKKTFREMLAVVEVAHQVRRRKGGPRPKLTTGDQLFLTLQYWRDSIVWPEYRQAHNGAPCL